MKYIAIMGMGTVGGGLYEAIKTNKEKLKKVVGDDIQIKYVLDKRPFIGHELEKNVVSDINVILNDKDVSVVAETMGGDRPAFDFSLACLKAGKSVVTSNKLVVEKHGKELEEAAKANGVSYLYEASVGGGIPVMHPLVNCLGGNEIIKIKGILNGTTNYILEKMEKDGSSFASALADAQKKGYAEADPTADIEGLDAARKICILASVCFGGWYGMDDCEIIKGISEITAEHIAEASALGYRIKLIGCAEKSDNGVRLFVKPCLVGKSALLASVSGVFNCVMATGNLVGDVAFYGHGAGGLATASAVLSDVIEAVTVKPSPVIKDKKLPTVKGGEGKTKVICGTEFEIAE